MRKPITLSIWIVLVAIANTPAYALDLGEALKDAAKQQIEKELGTDKPAEPTPTPAPALSLIHI